MSSRQDYRLRPLFDSDLERVLIWRNSERIKANMYSDHIILTEEHLTWFNNIKTNESCIYRIFEFQDKAIGLASATQIESYSNKCIWAFYLGEEEVPFGSGAVMEFLFLELLFEEKNIRKVCCEVFSFNQSTISLHKKFGFQEEGFFKQHVLKNGKYEDIVSLSLFQDHWLEIKPKMQKLCFRGTSKNV
jgi:UDP-4-amino-4,6-dideoxy-N-acetyl-beta-L-altrosamine N-acetyltransferase